jgi:SAM-dependent methyltransferase
MTQCHCKVGAETERTADGSLIELYRRMPPSGEPERIHAFLHPHSSVLELGAGIGRIADPLAQLGHHVTAVDDSDEMLAEVRHAYTVRDRIEDLRLPARFDAVLLITNLIHYPGVHLRRAVLTTVAHHLKPSGKAIIQWKPPTYWAARPAGWTDCKTSGALTTRVTVHSHRDGLVEGEYALITNGSRLLQCFHLEVLTVEELRRELKHVGLQLVTSAPESTEWLEAVLVRN